MIWSTQSGELFLRPEVRHGPPLYEDGVLPQNQVPISHSFSFSRISKRSCQSGAIGTQGVDTQVGWSLVFIIPFKVSIFLVLNLNDTEFMMELRCAYFTTYL